MFGQHNYSPVMLTTADSSTRIFLNCLHVDQICIDQICVDQICVDQIFVNQICVDQICVDQIFVDQMFVDQKTWNFSIIKIWHKLDTWTI